MLINCVAYQDGKRLTDIMIEAIGDHIARPDCFVWVALKDAKSVELDKMQEEFALHPLAVEDARHGHQRPKIEEYGDSLFAVLHTVEMSDNDLKLGEINIFVGPNYVLSVRTSTQKGFQEIRARTEREPHLLKHGAGFVFYAVMDAVVNRYFPVADALETELEHIEEQIFTKASARTNIQQLYELKQKAMKLKHAVAPLMEAVAKLHGTRVHPVCFKTQEYFRDIYDHLDRINTSINTIRETIEIAIQVTISLVAIEENHAHKRLAAWAAIFAIATTFVGIWGMNFKYMPELQWEYGYPMALGVIASTCGYLHYRFRKSRWL